MSKNWWICAVASVWLAVAVAGLFVVWSYDNGAGIAAAATPEWPATTRLVRAGDRPTLVFIAHPQCTCTRASLDELAEALARATSAPRTYIVFVKPSSMPDGWEKSELWNRAARLPGATIVRDDDGREAEVFGAATSGQTFVYDAEGSLQFSGGITGSRGHAGDNAGRASVVAVLNHLKSDRATAKVFGCSLFAAAKS
jgi:hypothetical protein